MDFGYLINCNTCAVKMELFNGDLCQCKKCGLISSNLPPDLGLYDKSYLRKYERYESSELGKQINELRMNFVTQLHESGSILDFGCGSGSFVKHCEESGFIINGFDINPNSTHCNVANLFKNHSMVTFWDSLEHLSDPFTTIRGLNPDRIVISTPSTDDIEGFPNYTIVEWQHYYPGEHVHYYSERSLKSLLNECGYEVTNISYKESEIRTSGGNKNILTMGGIKSNKV